MWNGDVYNMNINVTRRCILYIRNICWLLQGIDKTATATSTRKAVNVEYQKRDSLAQFDYMQSAKM